MSRDYKGAPAGMPWGLQWTIRSPSGRVLMPLMMTSPKREEQIVGRLQGPHPGPQVSPSAARFDRNSGFRHDVTLLYDVRMKEDPSKYVSGISSMSIKMLSVALVGVSLWRRYSLLYSWVVGPRDGATIYK